MYQWNSSQNHSSTKSPNFRRMKFLLDRVGYAPEQTLVNPVIRPEDLKDYKPYFGSRKGRSIYKLRK
jgi:hypothetical protein